MKTRKFFFLALVLIPLLVVSACGTLIGDYVGKDIGKQAQNINGKAPSAGHVLGRIAAQGISAIPETDDGIAPEAPAEDETPTDVTLQVRVPTNCRVGPGKKYDQVSVLHTGRIAKVIARDETGYYWVIENPEGEGTCWVWGYHATLTGPTSDLPIKDPPPPSTEVTLQVRVPTNCRVGPGKKYDQVSVLHTGKTAKVIGQDTTGYYWLIENPEGEGNCWVWGYHATLTGPASSLPIGDLQLTSTKVTLQVRVPTNCRVGPGKTYDQTSVLHTGKTANVVARDETGYYWVIENPEGQGICWVWGYYATLTGPTSTLPLGVLPPAPTDVTLQVRVPTNCRVGPGKTYDQVSVLHTGQIAKVIARDATGFYWVIKNPEGSGACWVWGYYATLTGSTTSLPIEDKP